MIAARFTYDTLTLIWSEMDSILGRRNAANNKA